MAGLKHFRHRRHDVSVLQIIDPAEQDFPFDEPTRFRGLEQLVEQTAEPRSLRRAYQREFEEFLREVRTWCGRLADGLHARSHRPVSRLRAAGLSDAADAGAGENVT